MPKRTYPFPESFSSQYKIHIGQREINNYSVFGNKYRQDVYESTKNLLFNGAKAVVGKIWSGEKCADSQPNGKISPCSQTLLRGQTLIGHDGKLTRTNAVQGAATAPTGCCVCHRNQGSRTLCSQCDRLACSSCTRQCSSCCSLCCSVCTITDYSGPYDEVLCCSCST
ncbi:apoptosis regulatory protein Siva [Cyprinodon tularosa]|uniref:SIVA1, apoptosis-inducing factor n=1 Tax=Cyprinodon variegatus TaxID=28743 RepID=A0A3Q2E4W8_CYPVA|nr:PREDICTED: apoptosis regulatory protein Siva [Cyprinodon variegatus]XP_038150381.1 apoptosis regulatory protein Siva [Cyprinodon tularosa]